MLSGRRSQGRQEVGGLFMSRLQTERVPQVFAGQIEALAGRGDDAEQHERFGVGAECSEAGLAQIRRVDQAARSAGRANLVEFRQLWSRGWLRCRAKGRIR